LINPYIIAIVSRFTSIGSAVNPLAIKQGPSFVMRGQSRPKDGAAPLAYAAHPRLRFSKTARRPPGVGAFTPVRNGLGSQSQRRVTQPAVTF
jgi:hypothetical protein